MVAGRDESQFAGRATLLRFAAGPTRRLRTLAAGARGNRAPAAPPDGRRAWTAEIEWRHTPAGARFCVIARSPQGADAARIAESPRLEWPPATTTAVEALGRAVRQLEAALLTAGWKALPSRGAWYAKRFAWEPVTAPRPAARRTAPMAWWGAAGMAAVLLGAALAAVPLVLVAAIAVPVLAALLVALSYEPRWLLVAVLVLLYSYAGWVLGHRAGLFDVTMVFLPVLLAMLLLRRALGGERVPLPREAGVLAALGIAWALSAVFAADTGRALANVGELAGWILLVALMASQLDTVRWYRRALWGIVLASGFLAGLTVLQAVTGSYGNDFRGFALVDVSSGVPRSAGPLQPNNFAQILVVAGPLAGYLALSARALPARVVGASVAAACVAGVVCTGSRGGSIALALVFALVMALAPVSRRALAGAAVAAVTVALLLVAPSDYMERFGAVTGVFGSGVESAQDSALRGRASENLAAVEMFADHPLLGVGVANYPVHYQEYSQEIGLDMRTAERSPHSLYLEALAQTGVIGAAVLFSVLWLALAGAWRARRALSGADRLMAEGAFVAICGYLIAGLFLHAAYPRYLWIVVGLGFAAGRLAGAAEPRPVPSRDARATIGFPGGLDRRTPSSSAG
jgi:putative inorganic carbon (HCO3(-)) transporter